MAVRAAANVGDVGTKSERGRVVARHDRRWVNVAPDAHPLRREEIHRPERQREKDQNAGHDFGQQPQDLHRGGSEDCQSILILASDSHRPMKYSS